MEFLTLFVIVCVWVFVLFVCLDGIFNIVLKKYFDYINKK